MRQYTHKGAREGTGRQPELTGREKLIGSAPIEPEAFLPIFIAEVLSPSTKDTDFTEKLEEYTAIGTLQTYLICSQDEPHAWVWARQGDGSWPDLAEELVGREGSITPGGPCIELSMAAVFRGIPDAPMVE
jgi:Uma2 family endonuclease